jgi:hypothetical protein
MSSVADHVELLDSVLDGFHTHSGGEGGTVP